jgi:hypothetical protein
MLLSLTSSLLVLARDLVEPELHPWENKQRTPSLQQVRRGMHKLLPRLGTPAQPPQPRGKSKGRSKGTKVKKAERFPVIRKTPNLPQPVPS